MFPFLQHVDDRLISGGILTSVIDDINLIDLRILIGQAFYRLFGQFRFFIVHGEDNGNAAAAFRVGGSRELQRVMDEGKKSLGHEINQNGKCGNSQKKLVGDGQLPIGQEEDTKGEKIQRDEPRNRKPALERKICGKGDAPTVQFSFIHGPFLLCRDANKTNKAVMHEENQPLSAQRTPSDVVVGGDPRLRSG